MSLLPDGFFHSIQQDPGDDAPRLVYADWLDDRGDDLSAGRAELIRVQVELTGLPPGSPRLAALATRQAELLEWGESDWAGRLARTAEGWAFRRGFVEAVRADASVFLEHAPDWFAEWPTLSVAKLTRAAGHLRELAASPWLAHLRGLDLGDCDISGDDLAPLVRSRNICLLEAIDLSGNPVGPRGAELLSTTAADELREVHLARCGLGGCGIDRLFSGNPWRWRRLDLAGNSLDRRAVVRLVEAEVTKSVVNLDLSDNRLGDDGAVDLADAPNVAGLIDLGLCNTCTGDAGLTALAESKSLTALRGLDLRNHLCWPHLDRHGDDHGGIGALARSPLLGQLRRLLLANDTTRTAWVADVLAIVRRPRRQTLCSLNWVVHYLRKSPYLVPSLLTECDLEELWWLGDRTNRDRMPSPWRD